MVAEYGMSDKVGPLSFGHDDPGAFFGGQSTKMSGHTAELIDQEVAALVNEAHDRATTILNEQRDLLDRLSQLLVTTEVIEGDELRAYADGSRAIPEPGTAIPRNGQAAAASITPPIPGSPPAVAPEGARRTGTPVAPPMPRLD
jgi:cell division protease FtsH